MIGSGASRPQFPVTLDNWQSAGQLEWTFQHMAEIFPTVPIARGAGPAPRIPSRDYDPSSLPVVCNDGRTADVEYVMANTDTDGWLVVHDHPQQGPAVLVERYPSGMEPSGLHLMMSVTKSVVGITIGSLVAQGLVDVEAPVTTYIPAFHDRGYAGAIVRNLLDMRSGIKFSEDYLDPRAEVRVLEQAFGWAPRLSPDVPGSLRDFLLSLRQERPHGGAFDYRSCESDVLGWIVEAATGARFAQVASDLVWSRIGAEFDANIGIDSEGSGMFDGGMSATLGDLARFGLMILRGGTSITGDQVVPSCVDRGQLRRRPGLDPRLRRFARGQPDAGRSLSQPVLDPGRVAAGVALSRHPRPDDLRQHRRPSGGRQAVQLADPTGRLAAVLHRLGLRRDQLRRLGVGDRVIISRRRHE